MSVVVADNPEDDGDGIDGVNILVGELRIMQYVDADGVLHTVDLSESNGGAELAEEQYEHLIGWAQAFALAPKVAAVLAGGFDG